MQKIHRLMFAFLAIFLFSGISFAEEEAIVREFNDIRTIKPGKFTEKCLILYPKQIFNYKFNSTKPVDFDIHYHSREGKEYFANEKEISGLEGKLTEFRFKKAYKSMSKKASICMLWRNNTDEPIDVTIDCDVTQK